LTLRNRVATIAAPADQENPMRRIFLAALGAALAAPAAAQTKLDFILNWVPGGDHAPYYYAKAQGWYAKEALDVNLEPGKGSMLAVQRSAPGPTRSASPTWPMR